MQEFGSRFAAALSFGAQLHEGHFRKGTTIPYVSHLLGVASIALEYGATENEAIAAMLHDAIEDQGGESTGQTIEQLFGKGVSDIVRGCSDSFGGPSKPPWKARKETYLAKLPHESDSIRLVSASDKLHNARAILRDLREVGPDVWKRFTAPQGEVLWYYRSLRDEFRRGGPASLAEELDRVVTEIEALAGKPAGSAR